MALRAPFSHFRRMVLLLICALFAGLIPAAAQTFPQGLVTAKKLTARSVPRQMAVTPATTATTAANAEAAKRKANEDIVTIIASGRQTGYTQFAEDISNVVEGIQENDLRVIPVLGKGAAQNIQDLLYIKGIDMGIVDRDVLDYLKKKDPAAFGDIDTRINYIAKLFNTELHIYARGDIKSLEDLRGKKISCLKEGSTVAVMCLNLFRALKIEVEIVYDDSDLARQKVKTGEVAAAARGATPPIPGFEKIKPDEGLHFVPISEESLPNSDLNAVRALYLPARLKHEDYPNMIPDGQDVPTIATSSLLAVYAWPANSTRYQRVQRFVQLFFDNIEKFHKAPRHPKWVDVNLAAEVPGWTRFPAAQEWLDAKRKATAQSGSARIAGDARMKAAFSKYLDDYTKASGAPGTEADKEALYAQFVQWWETVKTKQP